MATDCLFREDSYLRTCEARVVAVTDQGGIVLDRTVFYAKSGGQPGDTGAMSLPDGKKAVRYALAAVKGVGRDAMERLVEKRSEGGRFESLFDLRRLGRQLAFEARVDLLAARNDTVVAGSVRTLIGPRSVIHDPATHA